MCIKFYRPDVAETVYILCMRKVFEMVFSDDRL